MEKKLTMVYWKRGRFRLGKPLEHPEIMTQGETLEELEENLKDAYRLTVMARLMTLSQSILRICS
jgi:hypothetical protein